MVVKREENAYFFYLPSEVISDGTWWFDKLIIFDTACCIVDDADSSQRFAIHCLALRTFFLRQYTIPREQRKERTISQSIA